MQRRATCFCEPADSALECRGLGWGLRFAGKHDESALQQIEWLARRCACRCRPCALGCPVGFGRGIGCKPIQREPTRICRKCTEIMLGVPITSLRSPSRELKTYNQQPPPPPQTQSAQISATTKRGCRPWAGSPWGPGNRGADLLLPLPPPTEMGPDRKQAQHPPPPPSMPSHPHSRPSHGDRGPTPHGQGADAERRVCWDLGPAW